MLTSDLCPWLGTAEDRDVRHAQPSEVHVCFAQKRPGPIGLDHQAPYCLSPEHRSCPFYRVPEVPRSPAAVVPEVAGVEDEGGSGGRRAGRPLPWLLILLWVVVIALVAAALYFYLPLLLRPQARVPTGAPPTATPSVIATPTRTAAPPSATPSPAYAFVEPTATPTPFPGGAVLSLSPVASAVGWVASDETTGSHSGDSYLYSGVFDGIIYYGVFRLDLATVPRGAEIHDAVLELTGLDARRLSGDGTWQVRLLDMPADRDWSSLSYEQFHDAPVLWTLSPPLTSADLAPDVTHVFHLPSRLLDDLEARLLAGEYALVFRIDGPQTGPNNVFAWDSGHGPATRGARPRLQLSAGPAPRTPVPSGTPQIVIVTSTATPANVLTAAAIARTATAVVETTGTPTPTSANQWTATPTRVVTNTPTPANQATADYLHAVETAIAFTTGTATPLPPGVVTATPEGGATPTTRPPTVTPRPPTRTALPPSPTARVTASVPEKLKGLILFRSTRGGAEGLWTMSWNGGQPTEPLIETWAYDAAAGREALSPDGSQVVYVGTYGGYAAILVRPVRGGGSRPLVVFDSYQLSSPVWSPAGDLIAFVSRAGQAVQIWLISPSGSGLRELTTEEAGQATHPTFSPDGAWLAFALADASGRRQVWIMDVGGLGMANLSNNPHDEWDPVWVK